MTNKPAKNTNKLGIYLVFPFFCLYLQCLFDEKEGQPERIVY